MGEQKANYLPDREELAWAGGFFCGEGCIRINTAKTTKKWVRPRDYHRPYMSLVQTTQNGETPDVLIRFQRALGGLGSITGPYVKRHQKGRDYFAWSCSRFAHVQAIIAMLWPWLSGYKQKQAEGTLVKAVASARIPPYRRGKAEDYAAA